MRVRKTSLNVFAAVQNNKMVYWFDDSSLNKKEKEILSCKL